MEKLIFVKLGGSVITDKKKALTPKEAVIRRLGEEIRAAKRKFKGKIIIGHGSGSYGHSVASKYQTHKGIINSKSVEGAAKTAQAAANLNRLVIDNLIKVNLNAFSFAPSSFIVSGRGSNDKTFLNPIEESLKMNFVPVVYGDVVLDTNQGFAIYSTEKIFEVLLNRFYKKYKVQRVIYCGDTDGIYDKDGKTIPKITKKNLKKYRKSISGSKSTDVTGGMLHKVKQSLKLAEKYGIKTIIINGQRERKLTKVILSKKISGTEVVFG